MENEVIRGAYLYRRGIFFKVYSLGSTLGFHKAFIDHVCVFDSDLLIDIHLESQKHLIL